MSNILDGIVPLQTLDAPDDIVDISSDSSDEEMIVARVPDEVLTLDDALLALPELESNPDAGPGDQPVPPPTVPVDRAVHIQGM